MFHEELNFGDVFSAFDSDEESVQSSEADDDTLDEEDDGPILPRYGYWVREGPYERVYVAGTEDDRVDINLARQMGVNLARRENIVNQSSSVGWPGFPSEVVAPRFFGLLMEFLESFGFDIYSQSLESDAAEIVEVLNEMIAQQEEQRRISTEIRRRREEEERRRRERVEAQRRARRERRQANEEEAFNQFIHRLRLDSPLRRRTLTSFYEREDRREPDSVSDSWDNYDSLDPVIRRDSPYPDRLTRRTLSESEETSDLTCAVCLDSMSGSVTSLPCAHFFHHTCIETWLTDHNSCPVCRFRL